MSKAQIEFIGRGEVKHLSFQLDKLAAKRILLVTGKGSYSECGAKAILTPLLSKYEVSIFNQYSANPLFEEAISGVELYRKNKCDTIVAVGGGSAIDIAKSVNALQAHPDNELAIAKGTAKITKKLCPLLAIPTTAGTGSEATHFAVLYVNKQKFSIASNDLLPDVAIIDSQFTDNLPSYIQACTGFDALCQAIESYWSVGATEQSRQFAEKAIVLLVEDLSTAVTKNDLNAKDNVMRAANLAGKAINISKTTAPHALSYTITSLFGLPHGHAVALVLGRFFELHDKVISEQHKQSQDIQIFSRCMQNLYGLLRVNNALEARTQWIRMMKLCGLESDFKTVGIKSEEDIFSIIAGVNIERLGNHPIELTPEMMKYVFELR